MKDITEVQRDDLLSTFGLSEYEDLALKIIQYIAKGEENERLVKSWYPEAAKLKGAAKPFYIEDVCDNCTLFAMFAASGFVQNAWFPKGTFLISEEFKARLARKSISI